MNTESTENIFKKSKHDAINSTYKHRIYFSHLPDPMVGYSAKIGFRERTDKTEHLINTILRLMQYNYYPGSPRQIVSISFHMNSNDEIILTLCQTHADWNPKYFENKRLVSSISRLYDMREKQMPIEKIINHLYIKHRRKTPRFDYEDLSARFATARDLERYCQDLFKENYPQGEVEQYYRKYMEKHFRK